MENVLDIEEVFTSAVSVVRNLPKEGPIRPSDELKLKLYAYFKQATHGPNDTPKPRFYQIVEAYKWDAWHRLSGMSKQEAMMKYIGELKQIMDTIPENDRQLDDEMGQPFYDYCLNRSEGSVTVGSSAGYTSPSQRDNQQACASNSSSGSSVSLLDGAQSTLDVDNQFAVAILRLQRGLEETNSKLARIEDQLSKKISKKPNTPPSSSLFRNMKAIHWFYLSYPFLVYIVINSLNRRRNKSNRDRF